MEKRRFTRVLFDTKASVHFENRTLTGRVRDLSLNGALVETSETPSVGEAAEIRIFLSGTADELAIDVRGVVARCEEGVTAFRFQTMTPEDFFHLKNVVAHNIGDEDRVMYELRHSITHSPEAAPKESECGSKDE